MTKIMLFAHELVSNDFSSEVIRPVVTKCHIQLPWIGETKSCSNVPGRMTNMAAMPIYVKNVKCHSDFKVKTCFAETNGCSYESLKENGHENI